MAHNECGGLNPLPPITTAREDLDAQIQYFFEEQICDGLFAAVEAVALLKKFESQINADPELARSYKFILNDAQTAASLMEVANLRQHVSEHGATWLKHALSEPHCGDCTACPASCMRCHAEAYYGLPSSVTWSIHEGWAKYCENKTAVASLLEESHKKQYGG